MKKFLQNFSLVFSTILITFYLIEIFLTFYQNDYQKNLVSIHKTRVKNAQLLNHKIDLRSPKEFYDFILKEKNISLKKGYIYRKDIFKSKIIEDYKKNSKPIPFRGPYNSFTFAYNEYLNYALIENDRYGFKNPDIIYKNKIDIVLFGDSFAEGYGLSNEFDISGVLRKKNINTANFGIPGAGPILSYATVKEYIEDLKPKTVIFLYCEANDLSDLNFEKKDEYLSKYLDKNYKQGLSSRKKENLIFYKKFINEIGNNWDQTTYDIESRNKEYLKDIIELSNIKNILRKVNYILFQSKSDVKNLIMLVDKMKQTSNKYGSNFIFVYLPTWERYYTKNTKFSKYISLKEDILVLLRKNNINFIDIDKVFRDSSKNIESYFPLNFYGHYSKKGYSIVAESIANYIKK
tara:strand:+ start:633 stop:1847 length:1215 start_codon:yes stop_codon:yes gene_type:complete